jgi:RsiW-degrading membrane proteinase PrsW (M82 family)
MAQSAFVWVAVFIAFHVYWAFGGKIGFGDATQTQPKADSAAKWVFTILVGLTFLVGAIVPLAFYQDWGRRIPAWMLAWSCRIGAAILLLRGFSGVLDTSLRGTGLVCNGLTGLTYKEELGVAHPSA